MSYDKERAIAAQNSATAAAAVYAAELSSTGGTFDATRYEDIRTAIFNGTIDLAGIEAVVVALESHEPRTASGSAPSSAPRSTGGRPNADFKLNFGKNRGKTLAEIEDDYLEWVVQNSNNDFAVSKVREYLNAA